MNGLLTHTTKLHLETCRMIYYLLIKNQDLEAGKVVLFVSFYGLRRSLSMRFVSNLDLVP